MNVEAMLRAAGRDADWPATPDLVAEVTRRIGADARAAHADRRTRRIRFGRPLAIALAALLLLAATAAAVPGIREPVLDWLGLRSVRVERVPAPLPEAPGAHLGLGQRTNLLGVRKAIDFKPVFPSGLGGPTYYIEGFPPGGQLALAYRGGVFLTEIEGRLQRQYLFKFLGPDARAEAVTVDGERGLWITGKPHQFAYADRFGAVRSDTIRTARDVLLWRRGDLLLRLEGARSKAEALRIARSVRAAP